LPADDSRSETIAAAVSDVSERMSALVREEIELAKAEVTEKASTIARGAAAVAAGAVFGVFALVLGLFTLAWGLNSLINTVWIGFAIVFVLLLAATGAAFMFAMRKLRVGAPTPTMAIDEAKKIRATVAAKPEADV
jgi:Putative Actinobacterial Holin-X, holin superfamily III